MTRLGTLRDTCAPGEDEVRRPFGECNYSFFIVPFRYRLAVADEASRDGLMYKPHDFDMTPNGPERYRLEYPTGETRSVLFPGDATSVVKCETQWLDLVEAGRQGDKASPGLKVKVKWPDVGELEVEAGARLVLFDYSRAEQRGLSEYATAGCIGLLVVETRMPERKGLTTGDVESRESEGEGLSAGSFLAFNEQFRYLRWPHADKFEEDSDGRPLAWWSGTQLWLNEQLDIRLEGADVMELGPWRYLATLPIELTDGRMVTLEPDFTVYPDNRAFLASHMTLSGVDWSLGDTSALWTIWHQLLHVESAEQPKRGPLVRYEDEWIRSRTYFRWGESAVDGRLFGYSSYSFCSLCLDSSWDLPAQHFRQMYLDQTLLVLYQRTAIFSFSRELAHLTQRWKRHHWARVRKEFSQFQASFAQYVNLYWYPVFTHQVQGIELYELARRELDNADLFEELRRELDTTNAFLRDAAANRDASWSLKLALIAAIVTVFGVPLGILGANVVTQSEDGTWHFLQWNVWPVIGFTTGPLVVLFACCVVWPYLKDRFGWGDSDEG